eukprot:scaffold207658_cov30-Tisochrysis_lutea.AAC.4
MRDHPLTLLLPHYCARVANVGDHQLPVPKVGSNGCGARHGVVKVLLVHPDVAFGKSRSVGDLKVAVWLVHRLTKPRLERVAHVRRACVPLSAVPIEHPSEEGGAFASNGWHPPGSSLSGRGRHTYDTALVRREWRRARKTRLCKGSGGAALPVPERDPRVTQSVGKRLFTRLDAQVDLLAGEGLIRLELFIRSGMRGVTGRLPWLGDERRGGAAHEPRRTRRVADR